MTYLQFQLLIDLSRIVLAALVGILLAIALVAVAAVVATAVEVAAVVVTAVEEAAKLFKSPT